MWDDNSEYDILKKIGRRKSELDQGSIRSSLTDGVKRGFSLLGTKAALKVQKEVFLSLCPWLHTVCTKFAQSLHKVCLSASKSILI